LPDFQVQTSRREELIDVTAQVRAAIAETGVAEGVALVYTPHTTCGITVNEGHDPAVGHDVIEHLRELVPQEKRFRHAEGNSDSHIKAILVGGDVSLPVSRGKPHLGRWQAIFLCEFDGPRERDVWVRVTS
jgi:secondary thiamine-phosphate synthase enzyme